MIALLDAHRAGLFARKNILNNLIAGVIVGIVALPLAMAFAIASGVKPEQGLYTAIIAGFIVATCGGSRVQIAGPTGAFIVILAGVTAKYGIEGLQISTMMAGVFLLLMGFARLGNVIKFIPDPVITGFTAGIGIIIFTSQWKDFLGLPPAQGEYFHLKMLHLIETLPQLHMPTALLGIGSFILLLVSPKIFRKIPAPLIAMVAATLVQYFFGFNGVATIGSTFGGIPQTLPSFNMPQVTWTRMIELISPAFAIAMLGAIESLLSAVVADGMSTTTTHARHNSNQELIGQGLANIAAPLFGGFAATGAIARTATNIRNGGNSPLAGIIHSATLVVIILALAPLAAYIPLCALAAILFVVAWNMSDVPHFVKTLRRAPRGDVVVLLVTFCLTVFTTLVIAVNIGLLLAVLLFLKRMIASVHIETQSPEHLARELGQNGKQAPILPPGVMVYSIDGPFFFGVAERFERALSAIHDDPKALILRLRNASFIDMTGLQALEDVAQHLARRNIRLILCETNPYIREKLERAGLLALVGPDNIFAQLDTAIESLHEQTQQD